MPLTFDEVGEIFQEAIDHQKDNDYAAAIRARRIVGERALAQMGLDALAPDLVATLKDANAMVAGVGFYAQHEGVVAVTDLGPHVLELTAYLLRILTYLEKHWDELPPGPTRDGWELFLVTNLRKDLESDIASYVASLAASGMIMIRTVWFKVMQDMAPTFCALRWGKLGPSVWGT